MKPELYDGLPFFIGTGTRVKAEDLPNVQNAIYARFRNVGEWATRYHKGQEVRKAIKDEEAGAVKNINMQYAYNAYFKFLHQSLKSLRDAFRITTNDYTVDVERPTAVMKSYLEALQLQNDLIADDAIYYGCAAIMLDVNLDAPEPQILVNRVKSAKLIYDFEQPGVGMFTIRITPELAFKYTFLPEFRRQQLYNRSIADAARVAELRVYIGELVVNDKLDTYLALVYERQVIYAEKARTLTYLRAVSINDKNDDCSPIYTALRASELSRDALKIVFDYNEELVNPIRTGPFTLDANVWNEAKHTRYLKLPPTQTQLGTLLPGQLDVNAVMGIQQQLNTLAQQASGLNEYTLGEASGSVRTAAEAMMLSDSASGILNILANKIKQQLIIPVLEDILEILKITMQGVTDIFDESLYIDADIAKDQQEGQMLLSLINMPMFGAVIQGLQGPQALQLFRWILEKLHVSGTASIFDSLLDNMMSTQNNIGVKQ